MAWHMTSCTLRSSKNTPSGPEHSGQQLSIRKKKIFQMHRYLQPLRRSNTFQTRSVLAQRGIVPRLTSARFFASHGLAVNEIQDRILEVVRAFDKVNGKKVSTRPLE
jgi:hypothetical protein